MHILIIGAAGMVAADQRGGDHRDCKRCKKQMLRPVRQKVEDPSRPASKVEPVKQRKNAAGGERPRSKPHRKIQNTLRHRLTLTGCLLSSQQGAGSRPLRRRRCRRSPRPGLGRRRALWRGWGGGGPHVGRISHMGRGLGHLGGA